MDVLFEGHYGVKLSGRWHTSPTECRGVAVIAHPYGFLGGSQDEPMVQLLVGHYVKRSMHVMTYNARGVPPSQGRVSWTMRSECEDMRLALAYAMDRATPDTRTPTVHVAGYSAGSIQASSVRPTLAGRWSDANVSYLLLSYPLGVRWALTCLHTSFFAHALDELVARTSDHVSVHVIYCTRDQFTSAERYRAWESHLRTLCPHCVVDAVDTDHMWSSPRARAVLVELLERQTTTNQVRSCFGRSREQH